VVIALQAMGYGPGSSHVEADDLAAAMEIAGIAHFSPTNQPLMDMLTQAMDEVLDPEAAALAARIRANLPGMGGLESFLTDPGGWLSMWVEPDMDDAVARRAITMVERPRPLGG
jgi:hypothetical protein